MADDSQQALSLWRLALVASIRSKVPDLSSRQMAILLVLYQEQWPQTVRGLAERLDISKPAIVRALDSLQKLGFVRRRRDQEDRRNVWIHRTVKGAVFLNEFAEFITAAEQQK